MNHNLKEILCIVALLTAFLVAYAGVEYKGGGKPPDKGGYAQQNVNGVQSNGGVEHGLMWTDGNEGGTVDANGVAYGKNGRAAGMNSSGETIFVDGDSRLKDSQGGDDVIRNPAGAAIGKSWNNGRAEWNCKPGDGCKSVLATENTDGNLVCDDPLDNSIKSPSCNETAVPKGTKIYHTLADAILASKDKFVNSCSAESSYKVLRTRKTGTDGRNGYLVAFRGYFQNEQDAKGAAPVSMALPENDVSDFEVIAFLHNHPPKTGRDMDWFSTADAIEAKKNGVDMFVYGCATKVFLWLHHEDGRVTDLKGNPVDLPNELIVYSIEKLPDEAMRKDAADKGYKYYSVRNSSIYYGYMEYAETSYNPNEWYNLGSCQGGVCHGIECAKIGMSQVGVRGWCKCPNRSANVVTGPLFRMGEDFNVADYSYFFCSDCYKCRKDFDDVASLINEGSSKCIWIWDVNVARANGLDGKTIPDGNAQQKLAEAQDRIMQIPDGEIVIPGLCKCESPIIWLFGESPNRIEMCKSCGRPRSPIPMLAKNPRQPRKLRRCRKTSTSVFVCTCDCETGVKPDIHASPYDDGDVELNLMCTKCSQVKYSAFASVREFKKKFADVKPDPRTMLVYMIGTDDIKGAMAAADKEELSRRGK